MEPTSAPECPRVPTECPRIWFYFDFFLTFCTYVNGHRAKELMCAASELNWNELRCPAHNVYSRVRQGPAERGHVGLLLVSTNLLRFAQNALITKCYSLCCLSQASANLMQCAYYLKFHISTFSLSKIMPSIYLAQVPKIEIPI